MKKASRRSKGKEYTRQNKGSWCPQMRNRKREACEALMRAKGKLKTREKETKVRASENRGLAEERRPEEQREGRAGEFFPLNPTKQPLPLLFLPLPQPESAHTQPHSTHPCTAFNFLTSFTSLQIPA